jgi:hypothetical protein
MRMLADSDSAQIRRDLDRVIALAPHLRVVPAHDTRAYDGIPLLAPEPGGSAATRQPLRP